GIAMAPRGIGSFLAMPIVGALVGRIDPRKLVGAGLVTAAITLVWLSKLSLNIGYWDVFWPQFIQGISLGLLFVPLTTITMDPIPKDRMGNATSIFNLMRNIGGSVGIASVTTLLARRNQTYINTLGAHVSPYDAGTQTVLDQIKQGLIAQGSDPVTAARQAEAALFAMVRRQAAMLSFNEVFWLLALIFLAVIPFVFLMKRPKGKGGVPAH
ncbi:MAG TPA: MFS transporter, partial [Nitrospiria bacterium]|nr:MFS transporter [Nitrospiria bacterium]